MILCGRFCDFGIFCVRDSAKFGKTQNLTKNPPPLPCGGGLRGGGG
ncbi:hypothetical protein [Helicobacter sp. 23-1045]